MLEKKLGLKLDKKRKERNNRQAEQEGLGVGFLSFLDRIDSKVRMDQHSYRKPERPYAFLLDENEVALSEGQLEINGNRAEGS